jgi:hypothetical protein
MRQRPCIATLSFVNARREHFWLDCAHEPAKAAAEPLTLESSSLELAVFDDWTRHMDFSDSCGDPIDARRAQAVIASVRTSDRVARSIPLRTLRGELMRRVWIGVCLFAIAASACAPRFVPMGFKQKPDPNRAYIYGRFRLDSKEGLSTLGTERVTFTIRCRNGETYNLRFQKWASLQLLPLPASVCQIEDVIADSGTGSTTAMGIGFIFGGIVGMAVGSAVSDSGGATMATFRLLKNEFLDPGGVYYVGDFTMTAKDNRKAEDRHNDWTMRLVDNYSATTAALKRNYTHFASARTENRVSH